MRLRKQFLMETLSAAMARQIADAATAFQKSQTGHAPESVSVVMDQETLVITLHGALSPAEKVMARNAGGAALVQEYHRQLFAGSSDALRREITRITGIEVQEAAAEIEPASGAVIHAFTTGNMVQIFHLAQRLTARSASHGTSSPTEYKPEAGNFAGSRPDKTKEPSCPPPTQP